MLLTEEGILEEIFADGVGISDSSRADLDLFVEMPFLNC
jgi:hypothetical protein